MVGRGDIAFRRRHAHVLAEAQGALNISFGAILSAYIGIGLSDVDNHPFDHHVMARFFLLLAAFVMSLCGKGQLSDTVGICLDLRHAVVHGTAVFSFQSALLWNGIGQR